MKKIFFLLSLCILFNNTKAQTFQCGTVEHEAILKAKDPGYMERRLAIEEFSNKIIEKQKISSTQKMGGVVLIPVVFHVVYKTAAQNISDARLYEQIDILNADFRRTNTDNTDTPDAFKDVSADCEIEFCLAKLGPDGVPTSGILRILTTEVSFGIDDQVKYNADGGSNAWPSDTYLNFWVCNLEEPYLGYAQFPGGPAATDGVVIDYLNVGNNPAAYPYHLGRTATHEVGHWLMLFHIWGDDTDCSGTDLIPDTENQKVATNSCPVFPKTDDCSPDFPGIMFMNYMDYTNDGCKNLFTNGQKGRMQSMFYIGGPRISILDADVCDIDLINAHAVTIAPNDFTCDTSFNPVISFKNYGSETIISLDVFYSLDGSVQPIFAWTGSVVTGGTEFISLPSINTTVGTHTISATLININDGSDADFTDNLITSDFSATIDNLSLPFEQGFESAGFPYSDYSIYNPDLHITWERTNDAASIGLNSVYMNHFENYSIGEIDEFTLPPIDFSTYVTAQLSFDVAYALQTPLGQFSDTLEVLISTDCRETWTEFYKKANPDLQTAPQTIAPFVPDADEWRKEIIDLSSFAGEPQVFIKFRTISENENNLYIDNININNGQNNINSSSGLTGLVIFPNPASERMQIEFSLEYPEKIELKIYNIIGNIVFQKNLDCHAGKNIYVLPLAGLTNGNYKLQLSLSLKTSTTTFVKL